MMMNISTSYKFNIFTAIFGLDTFAEAVYNKSVTVYVQKN